MLRITTTDQMANFVLCLYLLISFVSRGVETQHTSSIPRHPQDSVAPLRVRREPACFGRNCRLTCHCNNDCDGTNGKCSNSNCATDYDGPTCQRKNIASSKFVGRFPDDAYNPNKRITIDRKTRLVQLEVKDPGKEYRVIEVIVDIPNCTNAPPMHRKGCVHSYLHVYASLRDRTNFDSQHDKIKTDGATGQCTSEKVSSDDNIKGDQTSVFVLEYLCRPLQYIQLEAREQSVPVPFYQVKYFQCSNYTFDTECEKECKCKNRTEVCDKSTGACKAGCERGYGGTLCEPCKRGFYGDGCSEKCRCRTDTERCHHISGVCTSGCERGRVGPSCEFKCREGYFALSAGAESCEGKCRCADNTKCDHQTGMCERGACQIGWTGDTCQQCKDGRYGADCRNFCNCGDDVPCEMTSGKCGRVCPQGYIGTNCQTLQTKSPAVSEGVPREKKPIDVSLVVGVGVFLPVLLILLACIFGYIVHRRRRAVRRGSETNYENCACIFWYTDNMCLTANDDEDRHEDSRMDDRTDENSRRSTHSRSRSEGAGHDLHETASHPSSKSDISVKESASGRSLTILKDPHKSIKRGTHVDVATRFVKGLDEGPPAPNRVPVVSTQREAEKEKEREKERSKRRSTAADDSECTSKSRAKRSRRRRSNPDSSSSDESPDSQ